MSHRFISILCLYTLFGFYNKVNGQATACSCTVLVNPEYSGEIRLLKSPGGELVRSLRHNLAQDDFVVLTLQKSTAEYFYVSASYAIAGPIADGWIRKAEFIGVYSKVYAEGDSLLLRQLPDTSAAPVQVIPEYLPHLLMVVDCEKNGWLKIETELGGQRISGWLAPELQCANPYTTCS
jgi:hypothetical protein